MISAERNSGTIGPSAPRQRQLAHTPRSAQWPYRSSPNPSLRCFPVSNLTHGSSHIRPPLSAGSGFCSLFALSSFFLPISRTVSTCSDHGRAIDEGSSAASYPLHRASSTDCSSTRRASFPTTITLRASPSSTQSTFEAPCHRSARTYQRGVVLETRATPYVDLVLVLTASIGAVVHPSTLCS